MFYVLTTCETFSSRQFYIQPQPQRIFSLEQKGKKEALQHFTHEIKICPNRVSSLCIVIIILWR